jgi:methyl-accepting chemotaxis protein
MPPDPDAEQISRQREKFVKAFDDLAEATANIAAMSKKQIEIMNKQIESTNKLIEATGGLIETMMMPKDGMRDVIDEVLQEIQGLRDDMRIVAKAGGLSTALAALMGRRQRGG